MTRVVEGLWVVAVLGFLGLPATLALARRPFDAAVLLIPFGALTTAFSALVEVGARWSLTFSLAAGLVFTITGAVVLRRRNVRLDLGVSGWSLILPAVLALGPLIALRGAPTDFDARSLWWFHARWLLLGGATAVRNLSNPAFFPFSPDYPHLAPSAVAAVWRVHGGSGDSLAQTTCAIVTAAFVVVLAAACLRIFRPYGMLFAIGAASAMAGALWGFGGTQASSGSLDVLVAAEIGLAAICLLASDLDQTALGLGTLGIAAGAMTKNDGLTAAFAVAVLASIRLWRRGRRGALVPAAALIPGLVWQGLAHADGAQSGVAKGGSVVDLLGLDSAMLHRAPTAITHLGSVCALTAFGAMVALVALATDPRPHARAALRQSSALVLVASAVFFFTTIAYMLGNEPVLIYLSTSVNRVSITPRLILVEATLVAAAAALARQRSHILSGKPS